MIEAVRVTGLTMGVQALRALSLDSDSLVQVLVFPFTSKNPLTSLRFSFLIYKMEMITMPTFEDRG